ncbi:hypothetical protein IU451_28790 [Nocardia cyriacigeorgica]|uniref:hypothetical protein n=1 Tax=Nocardia cyriacigeorgica TaxID=135487 RepID=UPI00189330E3|nr:hypothetical protein [Nocardia cyriacigeorgica]MBF6326500.1 hypothetical protein [Nocardia cyriacigeorgica]
MPKPIDVTQNIRELGPPSPRVLAGIAEIVARHYREHPEALAAVLRPTGTVEPGV